MSLRNSIPAGSSQYVVEVLDGIHIPCLRNCKRQLEIGQSKVNIINKIDRPVSMDAGLHRHDVLVKLEEQGNV